jgi:hypothetical protein
MYCLGTAMNYVNTALLLMLKTQKYYLQIKNKARKPILLGRAVQIRERRW